MYIWLKEGLTSYNELSHKITASSLENVKCQLKLSAEKISVGKSWKISMFKT
jgi:hypothetical protein